MNFRTEHRYDRFGVAFGTDSWVALDHLGMLHADYSEKSRLDRQFYASAITTLYNAARLARTQSPGPYGRKDSARRRKLCDRVASIANDLEALKA